MIDRSKGKTIGLLAAALAILVAASVAPANEYIHEDARVRGKEIHFFADGGRQVSVVLGDFSLTLGKHVISGRDAVLWIKSRPAGRGLSLNEIEVYVEGNARVVEPGGVGTTDRTMFVNVRSLGRLTANGTMSDRPLKDFPLYRRAIVARERALRGGPAAKPQDPPSLIVSTDPPPEPGVRVTRPAEPGVEIADPLAPRRVDPVHFHAGRFSSQEIGEGADRRRVTIARGNVYLSQGNSDGELFLELRAQSAVVFSTRKADDANDLNAASKVPWAPNVTGLQVPGGGQEVITGVYLEGDVIVARGERSMRAPSAYYEFTSHRAVVLEPVFRTVQAQRNIPVYVRADEARILSERELSFTNARISTSDFHTPSYHIGAKRAYLKNITPYDDVGVRLGEHNWLSQIEDATFNVGGLPIAWLPRSESNLMEGHSALRRATVGSHGRMGFGGETQWHLFRLLGLLEPEGVDATLDLSWYDRGPFVGVDIEYDRETYHGYSMLYGFIDRDENDDFGEERKNLLAPDQRGRALVRHKQYLPNDWTLQAELSYLCDRNYLEQFFSGEFFGGKEQETLLYAKKQRDNWAFDTLLKYRLNRFEEQTESAPDMGLYLIGQPLAGDRLTLFSESHAGAKRHRIDEAVSETHGRFFARLDTRNEIAWPIHAGPVNIVPYATGRATYWSDSPEVGDVDYGLDEDGRTCRLYGQVGVRANMHLWRIYSDVRSRLWDLNGIKHVITPEVVAFLGESNRGTGPEHLYPMDPDIELHLRRQSGVAMGVSQRLQTKRGSGEEERTVDWMRINAIVGVYDNGPDLLPADGRFFFYRPEHSLGRNHLNLDYRWNISDATAFMAEGNFDIDTGRMRRWNLGLAVTRDPRLRYYIGTRTIMDLDSSIVTAGINYKINRKYSLNFFNQIDVDFDGHESMASSITLLRKFPRWYVGATVVLDHRTEDLGVYMTLWPEGVPEARIGSGRAQILAGSDLN